MKVLPKQCPKCRGDLFLQRDVEPYGDELRCLQCGKSLSRDELLALKHRRTAAEHSA